MIQEYIQYFKNNPENLWFKRKLYGWGWTPVRWQGWLTIVVYVWVVWSFFRDADAASHSVSDTLIRFAIPLVVATSALIVVCYKKGEKPRWQWGERKE